MSGGKVEKRSSDGIFRLVAEKVVKMWMNEGIPVIRPNNVQRRVAQCYMKFRNINKISKTSRDMKSPSAIKMEQFFDKLFDIALCNMQKSTPLQLPSCEECATD